METVISKIDLAKTDRLYYKATKNPQIVDLDSYYYLSIAGQCAPEAARFLDAIEAMYTTLYGIKFLCKGEDNDFVVPKMECHWYIDGGVENQQAFMQTPREQWRWKIMFRMPDFVEQHHFFQAMRQAIQKKPALNATFENVLFELVNEGKCAQILHLGAWEDEWPTLERLFAFVEQEELTINGYHKEIYITDPRRVAPADLKTILRYQVK
jgi:hypothetical protein